MIGRIRGILVEKTPGQALVECGGLGYEVDIPFTTFFNLPEPGQEVTLHTHFVVREDIQSLYGFVSRLDRNLFRLLIKVNGVGPKMAAGILSGLDAQQFIRCVEGRDIKSLVKLPGVGKKTAERLLIEMADRISQGSLYPRRQLQPSPQPARPSCRSQRRILQTKLRQRS